MRGSGMGGGAPLFQVGNWRGGLDLSSYRDNERK